MCDPISIISTAISGISTISGLMKANEQAQATRDAGAEAAAAASRQADIAEKQAQADATRAEQETNRRNAKKADANSIEAAASAAARDGQGSTMLTGPAGVDPKALLLGKNTLLGA